jgi:hypothetical protein
MTLRRRYEKVVDIDITHGENPSTFHNCVSVRGDDSKWVNGTLRLIEETIAGFQPQNRFFHRYKGIINTAVAIGLGAVITRALLTLLVPLIPEPQQASEPTALMTLIDTNPLARVLLVYGFFYIIGWFFASYLTGPIERLWPSVELQFGPEHTLMEKQRRTWLAKVAALGIVPLALQIIYDVLRSSGILGG